MQRGIRKLSSQILLAQLIIMTVSMAIGFVLIAQFVRHDLDVEYQARAALIGETFSEIPEVQTCIVTNTPACDATIQRLALQTASRTGATYVVTIDLNRVRHSHPLVEHIGEQVEEPLLVADGKEHLGVDHGFTGVNANARVPLWDASGKLVGEISVGIRESSVSSQLLAKLPTYGAWLLLALAFGTASSFIMARILKRRTFGLELDEIARLLQEHEATLHSIREGVLAVDATGRITVVNDQAQKLLHLPPSARGQRLTDVVASGPLRTALSSPDADKDEIVVTDDYWLVITRMAVNLDGRPHGMVFTIQDRTELAGLNRELDGVRSFSESMRAQQHEFSNRLHAVSGMLELGRTADAIDYLHEIRGTTADLDTALRTHIGAPMVIGLLLGKAAEANERGIELRISPDSNLSEEPAHVQAITTILGNLIDNAFDALVDAAPPRRVTVSIVEAPRTLTIRVDDSGPGIPREVAARMFESGFSTKKDAPGRHAGLGLALVHSTVTKLGGTITLLDGPGAQFRILLPRIHDTPAKVRT